MFIWLAIGVCLGIAARHYAPELWAKVRAAWDKAMRQAPGAS